MDELLKIHKSFGEPCGEYPEDEEVIKWIAGVVSSTNGYLNAFQLSKLREIGEYLHCEGFPNGSEDVNKEAREAYYILYDSVAGRS